MRRTSAVIACLLVSLMLLGAVSNPWYVKSLLVGGGPTDADGGAVIEDNGDAEFTGDVVVGGTLDVDFTALDLEVLSLEVGGGAGSTGATITAAGAAEFDGTVDANGDLLVGDDSDFGGGFGTTGLTIHDSGNLDTDGQIRFGGGFGATGGTLDSTGNGDFDGQVRVGGGAGATGATFESDGDATFDGIVEADDIASATFVSSPGFGNAGDVAFEAFDDTTDTLLTFQNSDGTYELNFSFEGFITALGIHNNGGTGADGALASGTYTPTLTNPGNVSSSTAYECRWTRVGQVVTVSGRLDATASDANQVVMRLTLPITSNITGDIECAGAGCARTSTFHYPADVVADDAVDKAMVRWNAGAAAAYSVNFTFQYEVLS